MGQFNSDLLGPTEVETWDTLMGAQDPSWNQPAPQPYVESAADPMYAPAQELSYQQPYTAPEIGYGPDSPIYAPAEPAYGGPAEASYVDPFVTGDSTQQYVDPFMQQAYAPAPELGYAPTYEDIGIDPSMGQQFGWDQGVAAPTPASDPFFNNPQFAESNAQFDYTTNPQNRGSASVLGGLWNFANDALAAGQDVVGDVAQQAGNYMNPYGWNAPTASGYAGGRSREDNIVGDIARFAAEAQVPGSVPDAALLAFSDPAFEALGPAYRALRNPATREGLGEIPDIAIAGAQRRFPEMPGVVGDIAEITRKARGGAGIEDLTPDELQKIQDMQKFVQDLRSQGKTAEANELQSALNKALGGKQAGEAIQASQDFASQQAREAAIARQAATEDVAALAARTPGMQQIPDDVAAAIQRGANAGKAATAADELGQVVEGPGEEALQAALKRAEKMPLDSQTLLGVSELSDESKGLVAEHIRNAKALTEGVTQDVSRLRRTATRITGNLDNRVASEVAQQETNLYRQVINAEARLVDEFNRAASKVVTEGMSEADAIEAEALKMAHVESVFRKAKEATEVLRRSIEETLDTAGKLKFREAMKAYDAERMRAEQSLWKKIADAQQPLKELVLGGDISTVFQQGLRGARVGGTSALTGGLGRTVNLIGKALGGEGDLFGIYAKNGLTKVQQMIADGVRMGAEAVDLTRNRIPTSEERGILQKIKPAWNTYQKWNDKQFKAVDEFKRLVYEGRLMQEKAMGRNITDPKIRRAIAEFVNTAGSTASRPTAPMRGEAERAMFLTGSMTRAQVNELTQPIRAFSSRTEAANFLNQALSTAGVIGLAWKIQQTFGPDISLEDFINQSLNPTNPKMFGKLITSAGGKEYVNSFLPQASLATTFVKSYNDILGGDVKKLAEDWAKFGFGRQNIGLTTAENLGGFGYGKNGQFFWGDMPLDQRGKEAAPMPLAAKAVTLDSGINYKNIAEGAVSGDTGSVMDEIRKIDPYLVAAQATGELAYERSASDEQNSVAKEQFGKSFDELNVIQQAQLNAKLAAEGTEIPDYLRRKPYTDARDAAYLKVATAEFGEGFAKKYPTYDKLRDDVKKRMLAQGWDEMDISDDADKFIKDELGLSFDKEAHDIRIAIVQNDPDIVPSLSNPSEEVKKIYRDSKAGK